MPFSIRDTIQDSIPLYLRVEEYSICPDTYRIDFGNFELIPLDKSRLLFDREQMSGQTIHLTETGKAGAAMPLPQKLNGFIFSIFFISFLLYSYFFRKEFALFFADIKGFFSLKRYSATAYKEKSAIFETRFEVFLIFQALLIFSIVLFTYFCDTNSFAVLSFGYLNSLIGIFLILTVLLVIKLLIYKTVALFFLTDDINGWARRYFRLFELLGVTLFIPTLIYVYLPEFRYITIILISILFVVGRILIVVELFNIFVKNKIGSFYFFVYLCGTEIAPYLIFYKVVVLTISVIGNSII